MIFALDPKTFELHNPDVVPAGANFKRVKRSACKRWFVVDSEMKQRTRSKPWGEVVKVISFHFQTIANTKSGVIGPFTVEMGKEEAVKLLNRVSQRCGFPILKIVFHFDPLEFGTRHTPTDSEGNITLPAWELFL